MASSVSATWRYSDAPTIKTPASRSQDLRQLNDPFKETQEEFGLCAACALIDPGASHFPSETHWSILVWSAQGLNGLNHPRNSILQVHSRHPNCLRLMTMIRTSTNLASEVESNHGTYLKLTEKDEKSTVGKNHPA